MTMAHHPTIFLKKVIAELFLDNPPKEATKRQRIAHLSTIKMASNRLLPQQQPWHLNSIRFLT